MNMLAQCEAQSYEVLWDTYEVPMKLTDTMNSLWSFWTENFI